MQCLEPLVLLQSLAGWWLGEVAPADLATQLAVAARRPSGEPKTKVSEPGASLLQPSLPGCEWSELFHSDPGDSTKAFMSCPNSRWSYSGIQ